MGFPAEAPDHASPPCASLLIPEEQGADPALLWEGAELFPATRPAAPALLRTESVRASLGAANGHQWAKHNHLAKFYLPPLPCRRHWAWGSKASYGLCTVSKGFGAEYLIYKGDWNMSPCLRDLGGQRHYLT